MIGQFAVSIWTIATQRTMCETFAIQVLMPVIRPTFFLTVCPIIIKHLFFMDVLCFVIGPNPGSSKSTWAPERGLLISTHSPNHPTDTKDAL